jgi:3-hydroxyisobutyrate dehydrogenase-like beta-hydroxyacid dehydrogenase
MSAAPTVAVIAPGNMGAGVGRRLTENKVTVLTSLAGRSEESVKRAREAGMQPVEERALAEANFLLSITSHGDALARNPPRACPDRRQQKPIYVDTLISPPTMQKIADDRRTGCPFVGAGMGRPPSLAAQIQRSTCQVRRQKTLQSSMTTASSCACWTDR